MFDMVKRVTKRLFGRPATRLKPREPFAAARGRLTIDVDQCIFCGMCQRKCPAQAIAVDRGAKDWTLDPYACIICGACVDVCPKKCLKLTGEWRGSAAEHVSETAHPAPPTAKAAD